MRASAGLFLFIAVSANAAEGKIFDPSNGLLYNTKEDHSLSYECEKTPGNILACDFVQVSVRKKLKPQDAPKDLAKQMAQYEEALKDVRQKSTCSDVAENLALVEGRKALPKDSPFRDLNALARKDWLDLFGSLDAMCKEPSRANWEKVIKTGQSKDLRTCEVSSNKFRQTFAQASGQRNWVVRSSPEGACGVIELSRFELAPGETFFWKYVARKAVTNPNGESDGLFKCSNFDESEYVYDWRERELALGCDYIDFSPL